MSRNSLMACCATQRALEDAGLIDCDWIHEGGMGIAYGSCAGDPHSLMEIAALGVEKTTRKLNATTYVRFMAHTCAVNIGVFFSITGRVITTTSACTSGSQAIGYAYETIKNGYQRAMIAGGAEECSVANTAIFDTLFATSTQFNDKPQLTPRPFDAQRDGLVLGEGACTLILESLDSALERDAPIYAEVVGFSTNSDGKHITNPDSLKMAEVMTEALRDANLKPEDIGYINAHGTSTKLNDERETQAIKTVFGEHAKELAVSSTKSMTGHMLGAAGAVEAIFTALALQDSYLPATIGCEEPDSACDLDYVTGEGRSASLSYAMSNSLGFGGHNACILMKAWEG